MTWHEETQKWILTVSLAVERKLHFYSSSNLKDWELESVFENPALQDVWECPGLVPYKSVDETGEKNLYILLLSRGSESGTGDLGSFYVVGEFDGKAFKPLPDQHYPQDQLALQLMDFGNAFYAATSNYNVDSYSFTNRAGSEVQVQSQYVVAWMGNWGFAKDTPTTPWRNAMTLFREPRVLVNSQNVHKAYFVPVYKGKFEDVLRLDNPTWKELKSHETGTAKGSKLFYMEIEYTLTPGKADEFKMQLRSCIDSESDFMGTTFIINEKDLTATVNKVSAGFHPNY